MNCLQALAVAAAAFVAAGDAWRLQAAEAEAYVSMWVAEGEALSSEISERALALVLNEHCTKLDLHIEQAGLPDSSIHLAVRGARL